MAVCPCLPCLTGLLVSQLSNLRKRTDVEQMITGEITPDPWYEDTYREENERVVSGSCALDVCAVHSLCLLQQVKFTADLLFLTDSSSGVCLGLQEL